MQKFTVWLEMMDSVERAILGVIAGDSPITNDSEKHHLLQRRTTEFGHVLLNNLRNLGIIKNIANADLQRYSDIIKAIDKGISIEELVQMVRGSTIE